MVHASQNLFPCLVYFEFTNVAFFLVKGTSTDVTQARGLQVLAHQGYWKVAIPTQKARTFC